MIKTEQIDRLVEKIQKKIDLLKEQRTSLINQCVTKGLDPNVEMKDSGVEWIGEIPKGWKIIKLRTLVLTDQLEFQDGNHGEDHPNPDEFQTTGVPFIKPRDIQDGKVKWEFCDRLPIERSNNFRVGFSKNGDTLLVNRGGSIGKVCFVNDYQDDYSFFVINPQVTYVRGKDNLVSKYLYYVCLSDILRCGIDLILGHGSTFPFLGLSNMGDFRMVLPTDKEQERISDYLDGKISKIDRIVDIETNRIDLLKEYRQSIISSVVTGKIRVTEDMI